MSKKSKVFQIPRVPVQITIPAWNDGEYMLKGIGPSSIAVVVMIHEGEVQQFYIGDNYNMKLGEDYRLPHELIGIIPDTLTRDIALEAYAN